MIKTVTNATVPNASIVARCMAAETECSPAEDVAVCARYASNCTHSCSGKSLQNLVSFYPCFEEGFSECKCVGGSDVSRASTCLASSGLAADTYAKCKSDPAMLKSLKEQFNSDRYGKGVVINGKECPDCYSVENLRKALCSAGVKEACKSNVIV